MFQLRPLALCLVCSTPLIAASDDAIEELVVTGVKTESALRLTTDPKKPRQPLPAQDGADYLKTIPGFSVIRKGGADGDPIFRGMAGSRLSLVADGEMILGGCSNRMDPPSAYVFPETFDRIEIIKGPQSVLYGPGNSAGTVLFERDLDRPTQNGWRADASVLAGSWGRQDQMLDAKIFSQLYTLSVTASQTSQDNYDDGEGTEIHSEHNRWNGRLALALTPTDDIRMELSTNQSDGEAAYADRGVDGSVFDRQGWSFKYEQANLVPGLEILEFQFAKNEVDHVMDNYSLRTTSSSPVAMNPDRITENGRLSFDLKPGEQLDWAMGIDYQQDLHRNRATMNQLIRPYETLPRLDDAEYRQFGIFTEAVWSLSEQRRLVSGFRVDDWQIDDLRAEVALSMMLRQPNPTIGQTRNENLVSGFMRYEHEGLYAGVGHSERIPDYWEMIARETPNSISAFNIDPEKTTQLDVGYQFKRDRLSGAVSAYYSEVDDYLMIETGFVKPAGMMGNRLASVVRNIDARTWGLELDGRHIINEQWRAELTLASVRGSNDTDDKTLAQLPPIELNLGLHYDNQVWSASALWRGIDSQRRIDFGKGNIAGQDFGATAATNVFALNAGWRVNTQLTLTAGIDNLLDETYAEHVSRAGASISGFDQITRINEPGRTWWMKLQYNRL